MQHLAPQAIRMDNIVGARQQIIPRMGVIGVMSRPLRGRSSTASGPRLVASTAVRTAARASSWITPISVGRCSGSRNKPIFVFTNSSVGGNVVIIQKIILCVCGGFYRFLAIFVRKKRRFFLDNSKVRDIITLLSV